MAQQPSLIDYQGAALSVDDGATPMIQQYLRIKAKHPKCLLFYRMGDFYEMFFKDAEIASAALNIALTKRGKYNSEDISMCGVPVHAADNYLSRLIKQGFHVAVCEQVEDPAEAKKRGAKAVVKRDVIRIITPGTVTEDNLLNPKEHNFLLSIVRYKKNLGASWLDISTGEFFVQSLLETEIMSLLGRLDPGEILVPQSLYDSEFFSYDLWKDKMVIQADARFDSANGEERLISHFSHNMQGVFTEWENSAAGALLDYVLLTQMQQSFKVNSPQHIISSDYLEIDAASLRNLEIVRNISGDYKGSLLHSIDRCVSAAGARVLSQRLKSPLTDIAKINKRLEQVQWFFERESLRQDLRYILKQLPDFQRIMGRIFADRSSPRDLRALGVGLQVVPKVRAMILAEANKQEQTSKDWLGLCEALGYYDELCQLLQNSLADDLPQSPKDGNFIRKSYSAALDDICMKRDDGKRVIASLEMRYRKDTGVDNLKIKHNNILGYHVEVTSRHARRLQDNFSDIFIHRQTMVNAVRFMTVELSDLAREIGDASEAAIAMELEIYAELLEKVRDHVMGIELTALTFAALDCGASLAHLAVECNYCRPSLDSSLDFSIMGGRHAVVEQSLLIRGEEFIANDCDLARDRYLWLLTGPNMAGKSTYLRQNALIVILAQMGSFVPASSCQMGVVDRLFSRVGAADDLAQGRSTFMVEMIETACILERSTDRSLVILDEIGRGTATYDGLSIAHACVEYLHDKVCARALFATHYHELTQLSDKLSSLAVRAMAIKEWEGDVIFLHHVKEGVADKSYGIHVAKLAGLPPSVIVRASEILANLESSSSSFGDLPQSSSSHAGVSEVSEVSGSTILAERLRNLVLDDLSARQALDVLYDLRQLLED